MSVASQPAPRRTVKHGLRAWFGAGPRRHGEPIEGRAVSFIELLYDLVFVVLVGQTAHTLAVHPSWSSAGVFAAVFGLIWIGWINGTLYHELHGREDGRSRLYIFAQMAVLTVLAVFTGAAGTTDGKAFALTYAVLIALLFWQWYEVRRHDLPENRPASTPYLVALVVTIVVIVATAWLPEAVRVSAWAALVLGWVAVSTVSFIRRDPTQSFVEPTESLIERLALFIIIVLGETVVGVVNGITQAGQDALTIVTGVLGLCVGFGVWWNVFDIVGVREPRPERGRLAAWMFAHLPQCGAIAASGAAMVGLVTHAQADRTPPAVAWTLGGAVAVSLVFIAVQSASVQHDPDELGTRAITIIFLIGAVLVLVVAALTPRAWLLASLVVVVLSLTWLMTFVPPTSEEAAVNEPEGGPATTPPAI